MGDWQGDNPCYLMIRHLQDTDGAQVATVIDLDEHGWATKHADLMRKPGGWYLVEKEHSTIKLAMVVEVGDQPYYVARHVGVGSAIGLDQNEIIAFGIGKKKPDGHTERLWHFLDFGISVTGDDVNPIGLELLKAQVAMGTARRVIPSD